MKFFSLLDKFLGKDKLRRRVALLEEICDEHADIERRTLCEILDRLGVDGVSESLRDQPNEEVEKAIFRHVKDISDKHDEACDRIDYLNQHAEEAKGWLAHTREERDEAKMRTSALEAVIRSHRDQRGDDRCWLDDLELYGVLPEGSPDPSVMALPPKEVFLANCARYHDCRQAPNTQPSEGQQGRWITKAEFEKIQQERDEALVDAKRLSTLLPKGIK